MDEETNRLLQELIGAVKSSGGRTTPDVEKANKAYQDHIKLVLSGTKLDKDSQSLTAKGMKQEGQRQSLTTKAMRTTTKAIDGTLSIAQALETASTALRDNRESFSSLNPSIKMTGSAIAMAGKVTGGLISATVGAIPLIGGLGRAAGTVVASLSEAAGKIVTAVGQTFTRELDRVSGAFRTAAQTGALGADGMRGLGQQAVNAGLSFNSFAKTITKEGETLSFAFGTSAQAAKGLSDTTKAMRPFREQLLTLGIGVEQQNELTAKYIQFQQRQGRNEVNNTRALAQGSREYMKNLQELSKITGKSIEEQQNAIDAVQKDIRQGASIREIERQSGKAAAKATLNTIATLNKIEGLENVGDGLGDALSNAGTPAAKAFTMVMGSAGQTVIQGLKKGTLGQAEAMAMIQKQFVGFYKGLGGDKFASQGAKMGTAVDPMLKAMQTFMLTKDLGLAAKSATDETNKLANTQDSITKNVVSAQEQMIKSATALDDAILNKLLPSAAKTINEFAKIQTDVITSMVNYANILQTQGVAGLTKAMGDDAKNLLQGPNSDKVVEAQDKVNEKFMTGFEKVSTKLAQGIEWFVGGFSKDAENWLQAQRVDQQTRGGMSEGRFGKEALVQGYKLTPRATGGAARAGKEYLVGENGPEILKMGKTSGVVIPGQVGPGVPGRIPGTFDVKLGDGSVVTVDSRGNELYRKGPRIGGLQMSSSADGSTSANMKGSITQDGANVNYERDYVNGQLGGTKLSSGSFSAYSSKGGVASMQMGLGDGKTVGAQGAATGGQMDALSQLRSVAGPKLGNAGGLSISNQGLTDMEGGPAAGQTQTIQGDGGSNEKLLAVMQAMLDQQTKGTRLQGEQLNAARNN